MWLVAILLLLLVPVSWIGLLISWSEWMSFFETGKAIEPNYLSSLGLFSFAYVCFQISVLVWLAKNMVEQGDGGMLGSMIFFTVLILTAVVVVFS